MSDPIGGVDWDAIGRAFHAYVVNGSGLPADKVVYGQQDAPRPESPAIIMRISNIAETGRSWMDTKANPLVLADAVVSAVDAGANTFTSAAHGMLTGDGPRQVLSSGTLPGGILANTDYWIIVLDANTFQLADSYVHTGGGQGAGNPVTPIDLSSAGSGTITVTSTPDTVRAGAELLAVARTLLRVTLELRCHTGGVGVGLSVATAILQRIRTRRLWPTQVAILDAVNVGFLEAERVRAILGIRDALLFEPRSYLDLHFSIPSEESEALTIIGSADVTDLLTNVTRRIS